jgi:O-antigen/teichoic acid export membrane protein
VSTRAEPAPAEVPAAAAAVTPWDAGPGLSGRDDVRTRSAASDAAIYTAASYAAQALLFVAGLVQKSLLGPVGAGYWALMGTVTTFMNVAPLGSFDGASRQIPAHRGREDYDAASSAADTASTFTLLAATAASLLLATVALTVGAHWQAELRWGLVLVAATTPLRFLSDIHEVIIQGVKRFDAVSLSTVAKALVGLTAQTALVAWLGFYGMFAGVAVSSVAALAVWQRMGLAGRRRPAFRWRFDRARLRELITYGGPILLFSQTWLFFLAIDNIIVAGFLDVRRLGYYALAVSMTTYIMLLPKSIGATLYPRMAERFGRTGEVESIRRYVTDVQALLAFMLVPACVGAAFFFMPVLIRHFLQAFVPAISVVHVMVAASFFISLTSMPIKLLMSAGYRWTLTLLMVACLAVNAGANLFAIAVLGAGLKGAALATGASYLVLFLVVTGYALSRTMRARSVVAHIAQLLAVFAYLAAALWGIEDLVGAGGGGLVADAAVAAGKLALLGLALTPWLVLVERRYKGLTTLWDLVRAGAGRLRPA